MHLLRLSPSLQRVLLLPYIALVLGLSLVIGVFSYRSGSQSVEEVARHLLAETVQRIGISVQQQLGTAALVLGAAMPEGVPLPADLRGEQRSLIERFWTAASLNRDLNNYVYYGSRDGLAFGLLRRAAGEAELRIKWDPADHRRLYRLAGPRAAPVANGVEPTLFDPRLRPWYVQAAQARGDTWTPVYIDFGTHDLVLTRARGLRSADGSLQGVVATDVSLHQLNNLVHSLDISPHGLAFIVEPDGKLVASSKGANLIVDRHIGPQRFNAKDDPDPLVRETYKQLVRRLNAGDSALPGGTFHFDSAMGQAMHVAYSWVRDDAGLAWLTVVAVPSSDFMGDLGRNVLHTVLVALLAVVVAILLGVYIGTWILADIARLSSAAKRIGQGQFDVPLHIGRRDEIGQLAAALENMQAELGTDRLTGLSNRTALEGHLQRVILSPPAAVEFALLFIDLNGFKAINDTYGHEVGDLVLVEVAGRLRDTVRSSDLVARLGGDEFVIVLWRTGNAAQVAQVRDKLERHLGAPLATLREHVGERQVRVGAAVGVAIYPQDGDSIEGLLKHADKGMYRDKQRHKAYAQESS
ncbi:diguanylate cyclase domain-containing protein [Pseudomonas knackmussii]|uniref:diguanylate cyclase domain-containing protein n=1 Tax=Pseudomonas knackmussii TaxID=65741 RepID=UPI00136303EB|nr:diguanylate cyclase [Pseudomonas knackmussii]